MKNQRGFITVDFLFAIVLVLGFTSLLFVMTFTLIVASVTQYITYATARNYSVAHVDEATQEARGTAKYNELINNPVFKPLYSNGWYKIDAQPTIGDATQQFQGYQQASTGQYGYFNEFWGAGTHFVAPVLDFNIPFFGSTAPDSDGTGAGFTSYIGSYMGRDPSADECIQFTAGRWQAIQGLSGSYGQAGGGGGTYVPITDDGC